MKKLLVSLLTSLLLAACAAGPEPKVVAPEAVPAEQTGVTPIAAETGVTVPDSMTTGSVMESAKVAEEKGLQDKSVYFDFNMFVVKPEYRDLLRQHADILQAHPNDSVTLEGNADERGSPEYNLALGSKRVRTVRAQLVLLGIAKSRVHEASYGEERPRATCHEEKCWQQNRRVDFVYRTVP